jgi:predicted MFS family arabinose efflux permease
MEGFKKSDGFAALLGIIGVAVAVGLIAFEKLYHPTPEQWLWVLTGCIVIILLCMLAFGEDRSFPIGGFNRG